MGLIWDVLKKPFNFCWKTGAIVIGFALVVTLGVEAFNWIDEKLGLTHYYWCDEALGENIEVRYFSDNRYAVYDGVTDKRLTPKLRWVSSVPERDSLTVFCDKEGKRGYLNVNTGKIVIDGQYNHAWHFSEGLAAVVTKNNKVGFINYDNELVIPDVFDYVGNYDYIFKDGICVIYDCESEKYGAIDMTGALRLPMEYSRIFKGGEGLNYNTWYIRKDGKCGLVDENMNIIFEPIYDNIASYPEGGFAYLTLNGIKQKVSFDGEVLEAFVIDEAWPMEYTADAASEEGNYTYIHPYLVEVVVNYGCHGVMDSRTGKIIVPAVYSDVMLISKDLIMVELNGNEENNLVFNSKGVKIEQ